VIEVLITDKNIPYEASEEYFATLDLWAQNNCGSAYKGHEVVDVSDFSYEYDQVAAYKFTNRKKADWFYLAHGGK
jgi:hypothetical protein